MSILVFAGDKTNYYLYKILKREGYDTTLRGFDHLLDSPPKKDIVFKHFDTVIAPIPFTLNNQTIFSPYSERSYHIDRFFRLIPDNIKIIGGPFNFSDSRFYDITQNKDFTDHSVIPTLEEILKIIIEKSDLTLTGSRIKIFGEGRIAKALTNTLTDFNVKFTENPKSWDTIINTSSDFSMDKEILGVINKDSIIIDTAIKNSGIDYRYAKRVGFNIIKARGLPGKSAPQSVANYVFDTLIKEKIL